MDLREIEDRIDSQIKQAGIVLKHTEFEPDDPDVVIIRERKAPVIVINDLFTRDVPIVIRKAHKLSHVLDGDGKPDTYNFSLGFRRKSEVIANRGMVRRLAQIVYSDVPMENRNYIDFMVRFKLPSSYEHLVVETIQEI